MFWLAAILAIIVRTMHSATILFKNGYLPLLVKHHPKVLAFVEESAVNPAAEDVTEALYSRISAKSSIFGDLGGLLMIVFAVIVNWAAGDWYFK